MKMRAPRVAAIAAAMMLPVSPVSAQSADAPPVKKTAIVEPQPRRGYNVVLLLGDMQEAGGQDAIPLAARKALADMKDFLPYKSYRLLDTQWVLGSTSAPAITRLRGVDDQEYGLELRAQPTFNPGGGFAPSTTFVRFLLTDASEAAGTPAGESGRAPLPPKELAKADMVSVEIGREIFQLERERDDLVARIVRVKKQVDVGLKDPEEGKALGVQLNAVIQRISELEQTRTAASAKAGGRSVIDTSFRMEDGETVVVGTSKVKGGGRALIALLTATAERPKGSTR